MTSMAASDTIEAEGHLIDSGLLSAIFDKIIEFKASYEILTFNIGRTNDDPSRIEMRINAADTPVLEELLQQLTTFGCRPMQERATTPRWCLRPRTSFRRSPGAPIPRK